MSHVEGLVLASLSGQVAVVIAPGLTGTAEGFVEWFSPLLEGEAGVDVVASIDWRGFGGSVGPRRALSHACTHDKRPLLEVRLELNGGGHTVGMFAQASIDWRGFGGSVGPYTPEAPPSGPKAPDYSAISLDQLAEDLRSLVERMSSPPSPPPSPLSSPGSRRILLLAHSMGVNVLLTLAEKHGLSGFAGLALLDQGVKMCDEPAVARDPSFPAGHAMAATLSELAALTAPFTEFDEDKQAYTVLEGLKGFFQAPSPTKQTAIFAQTQAGVDRWMEHAARSGLNGAVVSRLIYDTCSRDLTGAVSGALRDSGVPTLWYGGELSLVPVEALRWAAEASSCTAQSCKAGGGRAVGGAPACVRPAGSPLHVYLEFSGTAGNHCPWLNEDGTQEEFMQAIHRFIAHSLARERAPAGWPKRCFRPARV
eukprot:CAMPEP_0117654684 /NCGR_PEP_ID=MMETSP0804-20121206/3877_1 /TAXON_ID=1074897 /ORGANISM="Tetraselmis astigmatica, Strain CCMP880" /LENGTH=422 /DNA_ID=CAMNT_0005460985 /DNA_START=535 /DNA_END=1804 /DNA_ORIENTATION=+